MIFHKQTKTFCGKKGNAIFKPGENVSVRGKSISIPINCYGYDIFDISKIQLVVYYHAARRSDWLSYYQAICYSPLVAKSADNLVGKKCLVQLQLAKVVLSRYFLPTSWILLKQFFLSPSPSWAIDSQPMRAQGIIIKQPPTQTFLAGEDVCFEPKDCLRGRLGSYYEQGRKNTQYVIIE